MAADLGGPALAVAVGFLMLSLVEPELAPLLGAHTGHLNWLSPANRHWHPWDAPVWWFAPLSVLWTGASVSTSPPCGTAGRSGSRPPEPVRGPSEARRGASGADRGPGRPAAARAGQRSGAPYLVRHSGAALLLPVAHGTP